MRQGIRGKMIGENDIGVNNLVKNVAGNHPYADRLRAYDGWYWQAAPALTQRFSAILGVRSFEAVCAAGVRGVVRERLCACGVPFAVPIMA